MAPRPIILVGIGMLDTGIDAPDVEVLLMARPTKSKILYVQMKGRGTRKCKETGKDIYKLVDFVDISHLEPLITNETRRRRGRACRARGRGNCRPRTRRRKRTGAADGGL